MFKVSEYKICEENWSGRRDYQRTLNIPRDWW